MADTDGGRYYAEELKVSNGEGARARLQEALDAGDRKEWHLVGVSDLAGDSVILFWDTRRPSFGRNQPLG
jgi:hypothetical protein